MYLQIRVIKVLKFTGFDHLNLNYNDCNSQKVKIKVVISKSV